MGDKHDLVLTLRSQTFECLRETFLQACLGVLGTSCIKKKRKEKGFFVLKRLSITDLFEGLCVVVRGGDVRRCITITGVQ